MTPARGFGPTSSRRLAGITGFVVALVAAALVAAAVASPATTERVALQTTRSDAVVAPGPPSPAAVDVTTVDQALLQPPGATAGAEALQGASVGGDVSWAEALSQNGDVPGAPETGDGFGGAVVVADVNGDGIGDLVVGSPGEDVGAVADAGSVTAIPGGVRDAAVGSATVHSQAGPMAGALEADDRFGAALAAGDFDDDGDIDVAVGAPGEDIGNAVDAGSVTIVPTSLFGLRESQSYAFSQNSGAIPGGAETDDRFASALAVGDFDGDGYDDLAVGVPGEDLGGHADAGAVIVLMGSAGGLSTVGARFYSQDTSGIVGAVEADDRFGAALGSGDVNGDGYDDLIVGVPGEDIGSIVDAGLLHVLFGSASGLAASANFAVGQYSTGVDGTAEAGDGFASAVAVADFDDDGLADIVAGVPGQDVGAAVDAGAVAVLPSSGTSIDTASDKVVHQATAGVVGAAESGDRFGAAVAAGDFVGDDHPDIAIGVPGEGIGTVPDAGAVAVLVASSAGISTNGNRLLTASTAGVPGAAEAQDQLGAALAIGDMNKDGAGDLAAGIPGEAIGALGGAGAVLTVDVRPLRPAAAQDLPDEQTGDQIHVIYAIPADHTPARAMDAAIRSDVAVVDAFMSQQLDGRQLRWDTVGGALDLSVVTLTATEAEIADTQGQLDIEALESELADLGFDDNEKAYLVYYEGQGTDPNTCGVSFSFFIAVLWLDACGGVYPTFTPFPDGSTYLHAHELTHLLGPVNAAAPNECCVGHVDDDNRDVLYQNPSGSTVRDWDNLRLDPGNDDYYKHPGAWPDLDTSDYLD